MSGKQHAPSATAPTVTAASVTAPSVKAASVRTPPHLGAHLPGWALRVAFVLVAVATALLQLPAGFWLGLAVVLIAISALRPRTMTAWGALALVGASLLWPQAESPWRFGGVLLGVHLTHLLGAWTLHVPTGALVQLRALGRPLARLAASQVVVQALAVVALHVRPPGATPVLGIVAAAALVGLALVLITPLVRAARRRE